MHCTVANVYSDLFLILRSILLLQKEKYNLRIVFWIGSFLLCSRSIDSYNKNQFLGSLKRINHIDVQFAERSIVSPFIISLFFTLGLLLARLLNRENFFSR
jgi:hypothetical protein